MAHQRSRLFMGLLGVVALWSGSVWAGWLGMAVRPPSGAEVEEVVAGGPAARAGIMVGDQVLAVNGLAINSVAQLTGMIGNLPHDVEVTVQLWRNGETLEVKALPILPPAVAVRTPTRPSVGPAWLGITVAVVSAGLTIKEVALDSPAHRAGLHQGDLLLNVNGHAITSPGLLNDLVSRQISGAPVVLDIVRDGQPLRMRVDLMVRPPEK